MDGANLATPTGSQSALIQLVQERLAAGQLPLPTLPDLALRIDAIVGAEAVGAADVATAISQDPATAARLIQAANSAYAASRVRVQSTQAAVTRLGLAYSRALVHRVALEQMFLARSYDLQRLAQECWRVSLDVAALSEALARECSDLAPETAMTAGLLHRVGLLPLIRLFDDEPELLDDETQLEPVATAVGPSIGRDLLAHWSFPRLLQEIPELAVMPDYQHTGPSDYADLVLTARYGCALAAGESAPTVPVHALGKLGLAPGRAFLQASTIRLAHEKARQRLEC
ncbi:HDOD domain-containing protein [Algiphilus aromaticivorans]|uniref:HDOD domain-containing protein n=1 Tax=Algiphilus aromaticivorans TaxID=382454 RepID=UPI0006935297|nr:HDOD domain-containing protein [Algiphilus aromaticivorans]